MIHTEELIQIYIKALDMFNENPKRYMNRDNFLTFLDKLIDLSEDNEKNV